MNTPRLPHIAWEIELEKLEANMPVFLEFQKLQATQLRAKYVALMQEGFSEVQALELCKGGL